MKKALITISIVIIIALAGIYVAFNQQPSPPEENPYVPTGPTGDKEPNAPAQPPTEFVTAKYKMVEFVDTEGIGTKAFSMLIPHDWQAEGSISWILDNPAMPVAGEFRAWNPNGYEEFHLFPNQAFFWSDYWFHQQTFPPGSRYFGALVHEPLGSIDSLIEIALPKFRSNVQNLKVVNQEGLPQVKQFFQTGTDPGTGVITSVEGGKIRVEYILNGVAFEEEFYCVLQSQNIPIQTTSGLTRNINWYITFVQSFRAEKGQLDSQSKMFQTIAYFARTDLNWLNKYNQVVDYLIQRQIKQIQSLGQLSSIVSQTSNDVSDANYDAWRQNQNVKDRLADDFSRSILGLESYRNPLDSSTIDLPSGYSSAWTNNLGEYVLSDAPSYNPNLESNLNWYQMTKP